jgi:hypothetical protein
VCLGLIMGSHILHPSSATIPRRSAQCPKLLYRLRRLSSSTGETVLNAREQHSCAHGGRRLRDQTRRSKSGFRALPSRLRPTQAIVRFREAPPRFRRSMWPRSWLGSLRRSCPSMRGMPLLLLRFLRPRVRLRHEQRLLRPRVWPLGLLQLHAWCLPLRCMPILRRRRCRRRSGPSC